MNLNDLLVSYKQIEPSKTVQPLLQNTPLYENYPEEIYNYEEENKVEDNEENKLPKFYTNIQKVKNSNLRTPIIKGTSQFEKYYDEVEKEYPIAKKYRSFLTKIARIESGFDPYVQNRAGAPAYGYFQFMQDGKKYNNISKYAGTDIETFRKNPKIQILAAVKLAQSFENGFTEQDKQLAKQQGFTPFGLLGGAWLAGNGGVRQYLKNRKNLSDKKWSSKGQGTTVEQRMREFNF